ncbi:MAG: ATP-binding protein [Kofleriaceae bacterium]
MLADDSYLACGFAHNVSTKFSLEQISFRLGLPTRDRIDNPALFIRRPISEQVDDNWLRAETVSGIVVLAEPEQTTPTQLEAHLVCISGPGQGSTFTLSRGATTIGRDKADILLSEGDVSRQHARITFQPQGYVLVDLGSFNGTTLNGAKVERPSLLSVGDRIQVGRTVLVLSIHDELAERVAKVQRLEAVGTLASGIAHDINNSLFVILSNLEALIEDFPEIGASSSTEDLRAGADAAVALAKRLLRLGKKELLQFVRVNVNDLVRRSAAMASRRASSAVEIHIDVPNELAINGVYDELHHAFLNLFLNAIDAMPSGGRITIVGRLESGLVKLIVSDTGCGMDERTKARIFEPFFTTKPTDKGTGLGLAMIDSTIRRHHGSIGVESRRGFGTSFTIGLPA